jgi:iron complex outermembrane receptor protein
MGIWHMNINRRRLACVPALTLCVLAPVHADMTPAAAPDPTADSSGLEEIVVTAQRRSESLERTPVAVTVIGSDALQRQDIVTEADLRRAVRVVHRPFMICSRCRC